METMGAGRMADRRVHLVRWILIGLLGLGIALQASLQNVRAQSAAEDRVTSQRVSIEHIRITSTRTFAEVKAALEAKLNRYDDRIAALLRDGQTERARAELEKLAAPTGLTILQSLNHGAALSLRGERRNAMQYGIGNVLTATEMTRHQLAAALYAPIRVLLYEGPSGMAVIEYGRPSTLFAPYGDKTIDSVASRLDVQLQTVLQEVSQ